MKQPWDLTLLTVHFWHGKPPAIGDGLETSTGRRYLIYAIHHKRDGTTLRALECVVLPKGDPIDGKIHPWQWSPRRSRHRV